MLLLGFHRKLTALALCKSIQSAIQWFQIHHRITFATIQNSAVYISGARVSIFSALVPRLLHIETICVGLFILYLKRGHREMFLNSDVFVPDGYFILSKQCRP